MNQPVSPIDENTFVATLRDRTATGVSMIAYPGGELPVWVNLQDTPNLVFTFAGAVDSNRFPLPYFASTSLPQHVPASIIAFADPSLTRAENFRLAWYTGHENFELQKILPELILRIIDRLGVTRVAFIGSSGGGFAALYYSWKTIGSVVIVSNPQTNINRYVQWHQQRYRSICWPSLDADTALDTIMEPNLCSLYAGRCTNSVIYLQEATDFYHTRQHFAPFVTSVSRDYFHRMTLRMGNWTQRGHHPAPSKIWLPWLNASLTASDLSAKSIETAWADENSPQNRPSKSHATGRRATIQDDQIAVMLARTAMDTLLDKPLSKTNEP